MKVIIIEDEQLAAERLAEMLHKVDFECQIEAILSSVKESIKWLMNNSTDLIFLDIQLSDGSAFNIFEELQITTPIIFTTAYDEYAIKAFKVNSIDYLLKPIREQDLRNSLTKYHSMESAFKGDLEGLVSSNLGVKPEYKNRFLIRIGDKYKKVETDQIAYFYAMEKSVFCKTFEGKMLPIDQSLDSLENGLNPEIFFRINRRYLVNIAAIRQMEAWSRSRIKLKLEPQVKDKLDTIVSIGRTAEFKKWMDS